VILSFALRAFTVVMLLYAVASWIPSIQGRWSGYVARIVEPVLMPVRRIIPPVGGLDIAFLVVLIFVGWLAGAVRNSACVGYYY
jgi:YggT family protein